jgi:hypothetical protein
VIAAPQPASAVALQHPVPSAPSAPPSSALSEPTLAAAPAPGQGHRAGDAPATAAGQPAQGAPTGLSAAPGGSSGGGFSPSFFLVIVLALAGLARLLCERLRLPSVIWRPVAFVSLLERPG